MNPWNRVGRDLVHVYFAQGQHIAIVIGKKPQRCSQIELVDLTQNPKVPVISVQCVCEGIEQHTDARCLDTYCVVKPMIAGPMRPFVTLLHRDGSELVKVEALPAFL